MLRKLLRGLLIGSVVTVVGLVLVGETQGFFGCFQKHQNAAAAMYGGTLCNPSGQQMTANYVPQTAYRVQYVSVPVTTYSPVVNTDPCTGCRTTCMRPTTCYQQQAQYVPYNTYRIVYTPTQPACAPATTSYYAAPIAASGCSSCNAGGATVGYAAPGAATMVMPATGYAPSASYTQPGVGAASIAPSLSATPTTSYYVAPQPKPAYSYPSSTTQGPGYNYGGAAAVPVYSAPSYAAPGYSTQSYAAPANMAPTNVAPSTSMPINSTPTYAAPSYASPANVAPSYAAPAYAAPTYANPSQSSVATAAPTYAYAAPTAGADASRMTVITPSVPATSTPTYSAPTYAAPSQATPHHAASPTTTAEPQYAPTRPTHLHYPNPTPAPAPAASSTAAPTPTTTYAMPVTPSAPLNGAANGTSNGASSPAPTPAPAAPSSTGTPMIPIPDPLSSPPAVESPTLEGPSLNKTSTPRLFDPLDKTATAWPVERAWSYSAIGATVAARPTRPVAAMPATHAVVQTSSLEFDRAMNAPTAAFQRSPSMPSMRDADGWQSAGR